MHKTLVAIALILSTAFAATLSDITITSTTAYNSATGITLTGAGSAGKLVADAGDFNGDGTRDYIVAADTKIYIVLGKTPARSATVDLTGTQGTDFLLITVDLSASPVTSIAYAGDINGDGNDDIAFGVSGQNLAFVVYGSNALTWTTWESAATGLTVDVNFATVNGKRGIKIIGPATSKFGASVAAAGDFDKSNKADLLVGAPDYESAGGTGEGMVCVVFGKALLADPVTGTTTATARGKDPVDCSTPASSLDGAGKKEGIVIIGKAGDKIGTSAALVGDMNGDGNKDVIIGAPTRTTGNIGAAYIVYGLAAASTTNIDLAGTPTPLGWTLVTGPATSNGAAGFGAVVAGGDFNNDQKYEAVIGYPGYDGTSKNDAGRVYVILGATPAAGAGKPLEAVDFGATVAATRAITFTGAAENDAFGTDVRSAGDINADGLNDFVIGAPLTSGTRAAGTGKVYVIYGKATLATQDLATTALTQTTGITITGPTGYGFGLNAAGVGDVTKDGISDIVIGAPLARTNAGNVYEIRGAKIDTATTPASGFRLHASLLVLASFFVALMF